jgi:uncharacterized protein YaiI (UPF0178 family)
VSGGSKIYRVKIWRITAVIAFVAVLSQFASETVFAARILDQEEVQDLITDKTEVWSKGGIYFSPDGLFLIRWEARNTTGKWWVENRNDRGVVCWHPKETTGFTAPSKKKVCNQRYVDAGGGKVYGEWKGKRNKRPYKFLEGNQMVSLGTPSKVKKLFDAMISNSNKTQTAKQEDSAKIWCRTSIAHEGRFVHEVTESRCKEMGGISSGGMSSAESNKNTRLKQSDTKDTKSSDADKTQTIKTQDSKAKTSELEDQIVNLTKDLELADKQLGHIQSVLDQSGQTHESEIASLQDQIDRINGRLRDSKAKHTEALHENKTIQKQFAALQEVYDGLNQEHEDQVKQFNDQLRKLEARRTEVVNENESTQHKLTALRAAYDDLSQEYEKLKSKYEPFKAELEAKYAVARLKDLLAVGGALVTDVKMFLKQNPTLKELVSLLQLNRKLKSALEAGKLDSLEAIYSKLVEKLKDIPEFSTFVEAKDKEKQVEQERKQKEELERQQKAEEKLIKNGEQLALSMRQYIVEHMDADDIEERLAKMTALEAAIDARDIEEIREFFKLVE